MSDTKSDIISKKNTLLVEGKFLAEEPAKANMTVGEWIDLLRHIAEKGALEGTQKRMAARMLATFVDQINADLAA